jgi:hypothetical protein
MKIFTLFAPMLLAGLVHAQQTSDIDIRFLRAKFTDPAAGNELVAVFMVSTKDTASFPPVMVMPPKCSIFIGQVETKLNLEPQMLSVQIDGEKIAENKITYELIKDQIDLNDLKRRMIITYTIRGIVSEFKRMSLTVAFKDKHNNAKRVEKRAEFEVMKN